MTKSTNGTSSTARLKGNEICDIIKACGDAGISYFRIGDLVLSCHRAVGEDLQTPSARQGATRDGHLLQAPNEMVLQTSEEEEIMRQANYAQLMVDDPSAYEQEQIDQIMHPDREEHVVNG